MSNDNNHLVKGTYGSGLVTQSQSASESVCAWQCIDDALVAMYTPQLALGNPLTLVEWQRILNGSNRAGSSGANLSCDAISLFFAL